MNMIVKKSTKHGEECVVQFMSTTSKQVASREVCWQDMHNRDIDPRNSIPMSNATYSPSRAHNIFRNTQKC